MENKNRLIVSVALLFVFWFMSSFSIRNERTAIILFALILVSSIWSLTEGIIFVKRKENREALPLVLIAICISLYALFVGIAGIVVSIYDLVEGGPFQTIGFLLIPVLAIVFSVLGIWAIVKGINLIRSKKKIKLGIISLIIGAVITIPVLIFLYDLIFI